MFGYSVPAERMYDEMSWTCREKYEEKRNWEREGWWGTKLYLAEITFYSRDKEDGFGVG
jgi:hypothetical protein